MQSSLEIKARTKEIARCIESKEDLRDFHKHLKGVVEGAAFRGSQRSGQFLQYVVEQAIAGHFEALKERAIGVKLFGRPPAYDTGEDAIVRVTASDVRRRLQLHYSGLDADSDFRICLPPGSYVPEIIREFQEAQDRVIAPAETSEARDALSAPVSPAVDVGSNQHEKHHFFQWLIFSLGIIVLLNIAMWAFFVRSPIHVQASSLSPDILPWSAFFAKGKRPAMLVTSDPNIAEIQGLTGIPVSVSDYANRRYVLNPGALPPEILRFCRDILRGDKTANVDTSIVANVSALAARNGSGINVRAARDLEFSDLGTDNNMIFLGSPRTDPWTALFESQMDFRIEYDKKLDQDIIYNVHPHRGEAAEYIPTAKGYATGSSYATISLVGNPNYAGQVLILAGANAEGTEAAGTVVTNLPSLSSALKQCSQPSAPGKAGLRHFQILLRLNTMAGSPFSFDVMACHTLP